MSIKAMKLALEALHHKNWFRFGSGKPNDPKVEAAITALNAAIEAAEKQEPVAWAMDYDIESVLSGFSTSLMGTAMRIESAFPKHRVKLLYTTPPQRTWVGLTDEELNQICNSLDYYGDRGLVELIEAKLKEKNT